MTLFLLRHAEAADTLPDEARELTSHGCDQVGQLASMLDVRLFEELAEVWYSPLVRSRQTAELLAGRLDLHLASHVRPELLPDAPTEAFLDLLAERKGEDNLLVVGHNPHLESVVTLLLGGDPRMPMLEFRKCCLVALQRLGHSGGGPAGVWNLLWCVFPGLLRPS